MILLQDIILAEKLVANGDVTYIEAIVNYCEAHGIQDPGSIKKLIPKPLKEKIEAEAIDLNYIKSTSQKLPID